MRLLTDIARILIEFDRKESPSVSSEDFEKMLRLLKFVAEGGLYGGLLAILGICIASLYAGWMGMTVVMLVFGLVLFCLGNRQLNGILCLGGTKARPALKQALLALGLFLVAVALMGLVDSCSTGIPRRIPDYYWITAGAVGLILTIAALLWITVGQD